MSQKGCIWDEGSDKEEDNEGSSPCRNFKWAYARERLLALSPYSWRPRRVRKIRVRSKRFNTFYT